MLNFFKKITQQRRRRRRLSYYSDEEERWNKLHLLTVGGYISNLSTTCDFPVLSTQLSIDYPPQYWETKMPASFRQELKEIFKVPRLNKLYETRNQVNKCHLLEAFLSLLLQLLYHETHSILGSSIDRIEELVKELRFLLTILGDLSWMLSDSLEHDAELQYLLSEFEELANQAGSFVHYLFFSNDTTTEKTKEGLAAVLCQTDLLKANLQPFVHMTTYTTPRTSIVDSILILHSVIDDLEALLKREDDPIADVKDQVNLIHKELRLSRSSIHGMRSPQPSEIEQLKEPLMRIGGIAHQAEYLITSFLVNDAPLWYVFKRLTDLNHRIEPIRTELQLITQKYQFEGLKRAEHFSSDLSLHDKRNTEIHDVTVGFETHILDQLVGGGTQSLQIISILGMPGLGKTTSAKKLYNHPLVNYTFDKLSWCVVSRTYKRQSVLANLLIHINSEIGKDRILKMEETSLVEHIYKTLKWRRYLVILDDIWDPNILDELCRCFPDDGNGSRILFTSRNKDVAPPNSILHELPFFTDEQCWELLEKKVFGGRTCPPELQKIGKKIAARCCGLPLTVVVIAGILSTVYEEKRTWKEVGEGLASFVDNSVMQILELSYKHLPDHLKPCFLYFGGFKEDEEISVGKLKRLWVAEGFIRKEKDKTAEDTAEEYLMMLIDKSLVMIAKRRVDQRGVKSCVVHDLLRDLCLKISKEESFLKYWNNEYHNVYYKGHHVRANRDSATLSYCQHIRSFVGDSQSSFFYVRDMRLLRVLHFNSIYTLEKRPTFGIDYLVNLRFLVIQRGLTRIERLVNLEYLCLKNGGMYLPVEITKMKKLRYVSALSTEYGEDWNNSHQTNLEYLSGLDIYNLKDEELLKCSPHLRKLKCTYAQRNGMEDEKSECPHFDLRFLTQLGSLSLFGSLRKKDFGFPSNIRKLTLVQSVLPWEKMSIVGRLKFLEVLKLGKDAFMGEKWDTRDGEFQELMYLQLRAIRLSKWNVASNEHFPKLQQLILIACKNLQEIPGEIGEITTLELIEVKPRCLNSVVESAERIKEEQRDMGNEDLRVIINTDSGSETPNWESPDSPMYGSTDEEDVA